MRPQERIAPIIEILDEVWRMFPDMRLGQLIENCNIDWHCEDLNSSVLRMCTFAGLPFHKYCLWGTRGKDGKSPLKYVRLYECETEHLKKIWEEVPGLSLEVISSIQEIFEERKIGLEKENK